MQYPFSPIFISPIFSRFIPTVSIGQPRWGIPNTLSAVVHHARDSLATSGGTGKCLMRPVNHMSLR